MLPIMALIVKLFLIANLFSKPTHSFKLLLLGDSVDRRAVENWCILKRSRGLRANFTASWCEEYEMGRVSHRWHCLSCQTDQDIVASVHLYGSGDVGPYHLSDYNDIYEGTAVRLPLMLSKFVSMHGTPNRVMFHTNQWDARCGEMDMNKHYKPVDSFKIDTLKRIAQIQQFFKHKKVDIGLRTAAWSVRGGDAIHKYNKIIRTISHEKNLTFYDLSDDLWSTMNYDKTMEWRLFGDAIHPLPPYTARIADKLLENQYTSALKFGSHSEMMKYNKKFDEDSPSTSLIAPFWLDDSSNAMYYYNDLNSSWHFVADKSFMKALMYGPKDVRLFDSTTKKKVTHENLASPTPTFFIDGDVLNSTSVPQLYHYGYSYITNVTNDRPLSGLCKSESGILRFCTCRFVHHAPYCFTCPFLTILHSCA
jgi:hypothetical protein